jgi:hypothetical protein
MSLNLIEVFKGKEDHKKCVKKVRSIGFAEYDNKADYCLLQINGLENDGYSLHPEKDIQTSYDYIICYENLNNKNLERVGVAYLLHGQNAGLIQLEWDLYSSKDIYLNLNNSKASSGLLKVAA